MNPWNVGRCSSRVPQRHGGILLQLKRLSRLKLSKEGEMYPNIQRQKIFKTLLMYPNQLGSQR